MLGWALAFAVLAILAGFLGFFSLAAWGDHRQALLCGLLVLLVANFAVGAIRGQSVT